MAQDVTTSNGVTAKQERFVAYLLAGAKMPAAARQVGVSERTAQRWFKLPAVQRLYRDTQAQAFEEALEELRTGAADAIKTLKHSMTDEKVPAYVRLQAAVAWLDKALEIHKMSALEQRISELEDALKERGQ